MTDTSDEFQKVENCGGKITFHIRDEGNKRFYSISLQGSRPHRAAFFGVYALVPQGIPVQTFRMGGIGKPFEPPTPPDCIPVFMLSDREGFFGHSCPACEGYFREMDASISGLAFCSYCGFVGHPHQFFTDGHLNYIRMYVTRFVEAYDNGHDVTIDMDELALESSSEAPPPHFYSEEKQQTRFKCPRCKCVADIMGQYGYCPSCGWRNSLQVLEGQLALLEDRVRNPRYGTDQRHAREAEWREIVKQCVSYFEGFGRDLISVLAKLPATLIRKKAIERIEFHHPLQAAADINAFFAVDILKDIGHEDQQFLNKRFLRRHIYEHNSGIADREYLAKSGDKVRLGQLVKEKSSQVQTLINLIRIMARNFDEGFQVILACRQRPPNV